MKGKVSIRELKNFGDERGSSFAVPAEALEYLERAEDIYLAAMKPGVVRGNHYHLRKRQAIIVLPGSKWSFHWDEGEGTEARQREFSGSHAVLILVDAGASQAVRNEGPGQLWLMAISSAKYDPAEVVERKVI